MEKHQDHSNPEPARGHANQIPTCFFRDVARIDDQELRKIEVCPDHHERKAKLAALAEEQGIELPDETFTGTLKDIRSAILKAAEEKAASSNRPAPAAAGSVTEAVEQAPAGPTDVHRTQFRSILAGKSSLDELEKYTLKNGEPALKSGRQELLEIHFNDILLGL